MPSTARRPIDSAAASQMVLLCFLWGLNHVFAKLAAPDISLVMQGAELRRLYQALAAALGDPQAALAEFRTLLGGGLGQRSLATEDRGFWPAATPVSCRGQARSAGADSTPTDRCAYS